MIHEQDQGALMTFVSSGSQRTEEKSAQTIVFNQQLVYLLSFFINKLFCSTILKLWFKQLPVAVHGGIPDMFFFFN